MAKGNIAQDEQILKSLEHSFKEIGNQHKQALEALAESQKYSRSVGNHLNEAWSQVVNLFAKIEQLRLMRLECKKEQ